MLPWLLPGLRRPLYRAQQRPVAHGSGGKRDAGPPWCSSRAMGEDSLLSSTVCFSSVPTQPSPEAAHHGQPGVSRESGLRWAGDRRVALARVSCLPSPESAVPAERCFGYWAGPRMLSGPVGVACALGRGVTPASSPEGTASCCPSLALVGCLSTPLSPWGQMVAVSGSARVTFQSMVRHHRPLCGEWIPSAPAAALHTSLPNCPLPTPPRERGHPSAASRTDATPLPAPSNGSRGISPQPALRARSQGKAQSCCHRPAPDPETSPLHGPGLTPGPAPSPYVPALSEGVGLRGRGLRRDGGGGLRRTQAGGRGHSGVRRGAGHTGTAVRGRGYAGVRR